MRIRDKLSFDKRILVKTNKAVLSNDIISSSLLIGISLTLSENSMGGLMKLLDGYTKWFNNIEISLGML